MNPAIHDGAPSQHQEAYDVLLSEADGHTGRIPPNLIVEQALKISEGGDFPLRRAALDALLRRIKSAKETSDGWSLKARLRGLAGLGLFRVSVGSGKSYRVQVRSFTTLDGSCECADFMRNALGFCKHLGWLLERGFDKKGRAQPGALSEPPLVWNPVRPLTGLGDWLDRVSWSLPEVDPELKPWFASGGAPRRLVSAFPENVEKRFELVSVLRRWALLGAADGRASPALLKLLEREEKTLLRRRQGSLTEKALKAALGKLERKLFPYQEEGVRRFLDAGRLLLGDDMGLGKTAQAIAACHVLHTTERVKRGLIIVPAALKSQWLREWRLFTKAPAAIVDGNPAARTRQYRAASSGFLIVNYEQVLKDLPQLLRFKPEMVVLDEAQRIKNWEAKTSVYVKQLQPAWRLVLSGTPLENRLTELASLMEWVDDLALEPKWRLEAWHAVRADGVQEVTGAKNLDTLRTRLKPCSLRRIRKEVLAQLPPRTDTRVPVPLTVEQEQAHAEFDQPIAKLLRASRQRPLTQPEFLRLMALMTRQRVICNGLAQRDFEETWPQLERARRPTEAALRGLFSPKLTELRELIANLVITQGRKVVIFSQWKRMLRLAEWATSDILGDAGFRAVYFTGDEGQKRRTQNVVEFHDDEPTKVLFATDAGGVGLNLQRAASACIHLDLPWNPAVLEQRSGRVYRFGQTKPVEIYALVSAGGIESRIASIVSDKKALFDGLFDGSSNEVRFEKGGSFLSNLQRMMDPVVLPDLPNALEEDESLEPSGDVMDSTAAPTEAKTPVPPTIPGKELLAGIRVERLPDGRMVLEAQPEAAARFAAMLEGVAALLKQMAPA